MQRRAISLFSVLCFFLLAAATALKAQTPPPIPAGHVRIHYFRPDGNYLGWAVYAFGDTTEDTANFNGGPVQVTGRDAFGAYFDVGVTSTAQNVGIIIHNGNTKEPGPNEFINPATQGNEYWQFSGSNVLRTTQPPTIQQTDPPIPAGKARIHYFRPDTKYASWTVYAFGDTTEDTGNFNGGPVFVTGYDTYGAFYDVGLTANPHDLGFIVHNISTGTKDPGPDMQPTAAQLLDAVFFKLQAFWIDRTTVAIQGQFLQSGFSYFLNYDTNANLQLTATGVTGGVSIPLTPFAGGLTSAELARFPQLSNYAVLRLPANTSTSLLAAALKGQIAVSSVGGDGSLKYVTSVQTAGVLDDLFFYTGKLGVIFPDRSRDDSRDANTCHGNEILLRVWAPTARSVNVQLFSAAADTAPAKTSAMQENEGVWSACVD